MKTFIFTLLISFVLFTGFGQSTKENKQLEKQGELLINSGQFGDAKVFYENLFAQDSTNENYRYNLGICYTHLTGKYKRGLFLLESIQERDNFPDLDFYRAYGHYLNSEFETALVVYNSYKNQLNKKNLPLKSQVNKEIRYTQNAIKLVRQPLQVEIKNLGQPLNSRDWEYVPAITADESMMMFTYKGKNSLGGKLNDKLKSDKNGSYTEDIMISYNTIAGWTAPQPIDELNTIGNDASISISADGSRLFMYKSDQNNTGDIYWTHAIGGRWQKPEKLKGDINSKAWEGSVSLTVDAKTIYFSSEREGGFGGKDLYTAELDSNGNWTNVENLGPKINTEGDEDAPFILPDNQTLYFSSNEHNSMGGFDVFFCKKLKDNTWSKPFNIGYPINNVYDNRYYVMAASGERGYITSLKGDGNLDYDIFSIKPSSDQENTKLLLVSGSVFLDDEIDEANFKVRDIETNKLSGDFNTNPKTKKYTLLLKPGKKYAINGFLGNKSMINDTLNISNLDTYVKMEHNIYTYNKDYEGPRKKNKSFQEEFDRQILLKKEKDKELMLANKINYSIEMSQIIDVTKKSITTTTKDENDKIITSQKSDSLDKPIYYVQITAYYNNESRIKKYNLSELGEIFMTKHNDGYKGYSMGKFNSKEEALELKNKIIAKGVLDAFIVCLYQDKRYYEYELSSLGF